MDTTYVVPTPIVRVGWMMDEGRRWSVWADARDGRLWTFEDGAGGRLAEVLDTRSVVGVSWWARDELGIFMGYGGPTCRECGASEDDVGERLEAPVGLCSGCRKAGVA